MQNQNQEPKPLILKKSLSIELIKHELNLEKTYMAILPEVFKETRVEIHPELEYDEILKNIRRKIALMKDLRLEKSREQMKKEIMIDILSLLAKLEGL